MDRVSDYRRAGDNVIFRFVYEANIVGFLQSLHSLLDSFPYLLNIFIPVFDDPEDKQVAWQKKFLAKYRSKPFHTELIDLWLNKDFQILKGYVNTIKHKRLIGIRNQWTHIEFESFSYERRYLDNSGSIAFSKEEAGGSDVLVYIISCHDALIPKLFALCDSVIECKENELSLSQ